jgi:hypothetical protein
MAPVTFDTYTPATRFPGGTIDTVQTYKGTADVIKVIAGLHLFIGTTIDAATLALPVAGVTDQNITGQDGIELLIIDTTGHAHTVTTPSTPVLGVVPSHHILTFNGTVGSYVKLVAYGGLWYPIGLSGVTAS